MANVHYIHLHVTDEQEAAIKNMFKQNGWIYHDDNKESGYGKTMEYADADLLILTDHDYTLPPSYADVDDCKGRNGRDEEFAEDHVEVKVEPADDGFQAAEDLPRQVEDDHRTACEPLSEGRTIDATAGLCTGEDDTALENGRPKIKKARKVDHGYSSLPKKRSAVQKMAGKKLKRCKMQRRSKVLIDQCTQTGQAEKTRSDEATEMGTGMVADDNFSDDGEIPPTAGMSDRCQGETDNVSDDGEIPPTAGMYDRGQGETKPHRCVHCRKTFLKRRYLKSHVSRMHAIVNTKHDNQADAIQNNQPHPMQNNQPVPKLRKKRTVLNPQFTKRGTPRKRSMWNKYKEEPKKFNKGHECQICGQDFKYAHKLQRHLNSSVHDVKIKPVYCIRPNDNWKYICESCGAEFPNHCLCLDHIEQNHEELIHMYECSLCGQGFGSKHQAKMHAGSHKETHSTARLLKDDKASQLAESKENYKIEECKVCGDTKGQKCSYEEHLEWHPELVMYQCDVCNQRFKVREELETHRGKEHPSYKEVFVCEVCGSLFSYKTHLDTHRVAIHKNLERRYSCDICAATFCKFQMCRTHKRTIHAPSNQYSCDICGKPCKNKMKLYLHQAVHRPANLPCPICNKLFKVNSDRRKHIRRHDRKNSFLCSYCEKSFQTRTLLDRHERGHTGEQDPRPPLDYKAGSSTLNLRCHLCSLVVQGGRRKMKEHIDALHPHTSRPVKTDWVQQAVAAVEELKSAGYVAEEEEMEIHFKNEDFYSEEVETTTSSSNWSLEKIDGTNIVYVTLPNNLKDDRPAQDQGKGFFVT